MEGFKRGDLVVIGKQNELVFAIVWQHTKNHTLHYYGLQTRKYVRGGTPPNKRNYGRYMYMPNTEAAISFAKGVRPKVDYSQDPTSAKVRLASVEMLTDEEKALYLDLKKYI